MAIKKPKKTIINKVENSTKKTAETTPKVDPKISQLLNSMNKKFGDRAIITGSQLAKENVYPRIPTGDLGLDISIGGGIPIGKYTQFAGEPSVTKTTQALHIIKNAQKLGLVCALLDVEGTTTRDYLEQIGVDVDNLIYTAPEGLEEATQMMIDFQKSKVVNFCVLDSICATTTVKEMESDMTETTQMGIPPKKWGEFFRKYTAHNNGLSRQQCTPFTVLAINQLRDKIGVMYGDTEFTPGGKAKDFFNVLDIRLRRGDYIVEGSNKDKKIVGQVVKYKINKGKIQGATRGTSGEFDFYFKENSLGIPKGHNDEVKTVIALAVKYNLIQKGGAWFYMNKDTKDEIKFQGFSNLVDYLRSNHEVIKELEGTIRKISADIKVI